MSEQKKPSFMQELDQWTDANVVSVLLAPHVFAEEMPDCEPQIALVKKAIREKVLVSFKNGLKAQARGVPARKEQHAQAKAR